MSAYDDAVAYLDAEVHSRCDYDIYRDMRDIVDEMEDEMERLRELAKNMHGWLVVNYEKSYVIPLNGLNDIERDMHELGIEVEQ